MAVFPESMDRLDTEDVSGSLRIIENYIGYIDERVEFSMRNMTRNVEKAGISSVEMYILLTAVQNNLSAINSTIQSMGAEITGVQTALSIVNTTLTQIQGDITDMQESIADLDRRVTALENETGDS